MFQSQKQFFAQHVTHSVDFRKEKLQLLKQAILKREDQIIDALHRDFRKPAAEAYGSEIGILISEIDHTIKKLRSWAKPKKVRSSWLNFPSKDYIYPSPKGVTLIIGAWNYPFLLTISPLVASLAAGNTAILKPSELSPNVSGLIAELVKSTLPSNYCHVAEGGVQQTQALLDLPFDHIFFTGSPRVGKIVMEKASRQLVPVTLELGGKSPCIVDETARLKTSARRIIWGKFYNGGQTCIAPDYLLVHESVKEELVEELKNCITEFFGENPKESADLARIINQNHFERILSYIEPHHTIRCGGKHDISELYIAPTLLENVSWEDAVLQEEIFGPLLPIVTYQDLDEAVFQIQKNRNPLALYFFTEKKTHREKILKEVLFGGGCVNDTLSHLTNPHLPFGGIGNSGMGCYHGKPGFDTFSHSKSVLKRGSWLDLPLKYPPYEGKLPWIKKLIRYLG
ncbi:MAG: aldehyde dehydrogenase [Cytophagales bacterium]|nr:aldehyde dehydrogenase [Cytophagales bacterium]